MKNRIRLPTLKENFPDIALVLGFLMLIYGIWQIYMPAAFITGGILLLLFGFPPRKGR